MLPEVLVNVCVRGEGGMQSLTTTNLGVKYVVVLISQSCIEMGITGWEGEKPEAFDITVTFLLSKSSHAF